MRNLSVAILLLAVFATTARAQGGNPVEKLRQKMEEISNLMRDSEELLLKLTKVDALIAKQQEILRRLREIEPPLENESAEAKRDEQRQQLRQEQERIAHELRNLLEQQAQMSDLTVEELQKLLENLPRTQSGGGGHGKKQKRQKKKERDKRLGEKREEQKQERPESRRDKKDLFKDKKRQDGKRSDEKTGSAAQRMVDAWIARLPPEEMERLLRGDLSAVPAPYRRLVREYTILRAKREAEEEAEGR